MHTSCQVARCTAYDGPAPRGCYGFTGFTGNQVLASWVQWAVEQTGEPHTGATGDGAIIGGRTGSLEGWRGPLENQHPEWGVKNL